MRTWQAQYVELAARPDVEHVLVFENRGEVVGVSNPHPHCQVSATNFVFKSTELEIEAEQTDGRRVIAERLSRDERDGYQRACKPPRWRMRRGSTVYTRRVSVVVPGVVGEPVPCAHSVSPLESIACFVFESRERNHRRTACSCGRQLRSALHW
jgi:hypothetical protein